MNSFAGSAAVSEVSRASAALSPPDADTSLYAKGVYDPLTKKIHFRNCRWFTNIDLGKRHEVLQLDTMAHNLKFNKKLRNKLEKDYKKLEYPCFDNYNVL